MPTYASGTDIELLPTPDNKIRIVTEVCCVRSNPFSKRFVLHRGVVRLQLIDGFEVDRRLAHIDNTHSERKSPL